MRRDTQPAKVEAVAGAGTDSKGTSETPNVDVPDAVTVLMQEVSLHQWQHC
ncbi:hypothetical protein PR003_g5935 [Phytophthora rubi]|uniref:Uncharacterized protein n=1 Tax=Phytophthora rubi TaxID=129364 RepID=A0A6A3M1B4_9STRA|nr:hypothetical protein PR001_g12437 [Phytophthora rubi]KAE9349336.1 hypothetical protein PR003_g5935 [Phytophthora rubi]